MTTSTPSATLEVLEHGHLHPFADFRALKDIPRSGALIYTIWDAAGALIYVGVSGRSRTSKREPWGRLRQHFSGRRSGDQFAVYVADHYVLPALTRDHVEAIAAPEPTLFMDDLVAVHVRRHFAFRYAVTQDYATARTTEDAIKGGALSAGPPRLNPERRRRRDIDALAATL